MMLWLGGLRRLQQEQERRERPATVAAAIIRIVEMAPSYRWQHEIEWCLRDAFSAVAEDTLADNAERDE
jgi:hypothetical protein